MKGLSAIDWINIVLGLIILYFVVTQLYMWYTVKKTATLIDNEQFKQGMHHAQVIDVRQPDAFKSGHILGARNIPYAQLHYYESSLRHDTPIYLYDEGKAISIRAARRLAKQGYKQIYILKSGYAKWDGKTKVKKQ